MLKITKCEQTINQNVKRKSVLRAFKEKDLVNNYFFIFFYMKIILIQRKIMLMQTEVNIMTSRGSWKILICSRNE